MSVGAINIVRKDPMSCSPVGFVLRTIGLNMGRNDEVLISLQEK